MPAQKLAQTRPGARGALLFEACVPPTEFGARLAGRAFPSRSTAWTPTRSSPTSGDLDVAKELTAER